MQTQQDRPCLSLLFRLDKPNEYEALHHWRTAFGPATDTEAVDENVFALHIWPGCWCDTSSREAP
jgi:hypothetical protein